MYTDFNTVPRIGAVNIATVDLDYVWGVVAEQVARYREYRYVTPGYIPSDHLLLRILNSLNVEFDGDLMGYQVKVAAQCSRLAGTMGLTSGAHHGRLHKGHFYSKDISELYVVTTDVVAPRDLWTRWERLSAVRVLSHPIRDVTVLELDGTINTSPLSAGGMNVAVMELNIPLLACQYQLWKLGERSRRMRAEAVPDSYFISQLVVPNLLDSHLNVAVLNSLCQKVGMEDTATVVSNLPYYLSDVSTRYNRGLDEVLKRFTVQTTTFNDMLMNIPTPGGRLMDAVRMPEVSFTNQVLWALVMARLRLIAFLLRINVVNGNAKNDAYLIRFRRTLIEADSGKYLSNQVPVALQTGLATFIDQNLRPYLKDY